MHTASELQQAETDSPIDLELRRARVLARLTAEKLAAALRHDPPITLSVLSRLARRASLAAGRLATFAHLASH